MGSSGQTINQNTGAAFAPAAPAPAPAKPTPALTGGVSKAPPAGTVNESLISGGYVDSNGKVIQGSPAGGGNGGGGGSSASAPASGGGTSSQSAQPAQISKLAPEQNVSKVPIPLAANNLESTAGMYSGNVSASSTTEIAAGAKEADIEYLSRALGVAPGAITDKMLAQLGPYSYENLSKTAIFDLNASSNFSTRQTKAQQISEYSGVSSTGLSPPASASAPSSSSAQPPVAGTVLGGFESVQGISYTFTAGTTYGLSTAKGTTLITPTITTVSDVNAPKFTAFAQSENSAVLGGFSTNAGPGLVLGPPSPAPVKLTPEQSVLIANQNQALDFEGKTGYSLLSNAPYFGFVFQAVSPFRFASFIEDIPAIASTAVRYKLPQIYAGLTQPGAENFAIQEGQTFKAGMVNAITNPQTYILAAVGAGFAIAEGNTGFGFGASSQTSDAASARIIISEPKAITTFEGSATLEPAEAVQRQPSSISFEGPVKGKEVISMDENPNGFEGLKAEGTFKVATKTTIENSNPLFNFFSKPETSGQEISGSIEAFQPKEPAFSSGPYGNQEPMLVGGKVNLAGQASNVIDLSPPDLPAAGDIQTAPALPLDKTQVVSAIPIEQTFTTPRTAGISSGRAAIDIFDIERPGAAIYQAPDYSLAYNVKATQGLTSIQSASEISVPFGVEVLKAEPLENIPQAQFSATDNLEISEGERLPEVLELTRGEGLVPRGIDFIESSRSIRSISNIGGRLEASKAQIVDLVAQQNEGSVEILYKSGKSQRYDAAGELQDLKISGESVLIAKGGRLSDEELFSQSEVFPVKGARLSQEALPPFIEPGARGAQLVQKAGAGQGANGVMDLGLNGGQLQLQSQTLKGIGAALGEFGEKAASSAQTQALQGSNLKEISLDLNLGQIFKVGQGQEETQSIRPLMGTAMDLGQIQLPNQRTRANQGLAQEDIQLITPRTSQLSLQNIGQLDDTRTAQKDFFRQDQPQLQSTRQDQSQILRQNEAQTTDFFSQTPFMPPPPSITDMPPPPIGGGLSGFGFEFNTPKTIGRGKRQPGQYTPSLVALEFNLRGKKENLGGYQSGFGLRPIATASRGKKR